MRYAFPLLVVALATNAVHAQAVGDSKIQYFENHIRPALVKYCYQCHSAKSGKSRAGLYVDTRDGLLEGGDQGPALVPGKPRQSLLWKAINWSGVKMPPSKQMPAEVLAKFETWIEMGAPDPRTRQLQKFQSKITKEDIEKGKRHWSFQPPKAKPGASIDGIVTAQLEAKGLKPAAPADGYTLLRRVSFDLVGLPPSPEEIQAFQTAWKRNPDAALTIKVDELLKRPQYGERWGRHWLDVVRYAESSGSRNVSYPHAWRYRDYVIDSFNDDTPYDRFIAEQIAGDLLPTKTDAQWQKNLIATGFLAIGMKHHDERNPRKFLVDMIDEQIDTTTQAVLGLTVSCARCHDHKYDPIPTADYYALAGIFHSTQTYYGTTRIGQNHRPSELLILPIPDKTPVNAGRSKQAIAQLEARIATLDRQMAAAANGKERRNIRNKRNRVAAQLAALNPDGTAKTFGMGVQEAKQMVDAYILLGGEVERVAQQVPRGFLQVLGDLNFRVTDRKSSGRRELVAALTSKDNPLTARVMANRIWMDLLGKPLVETPSNFGFSGMKPENQELLDYLAVRFMERDWSMKTMIREIVLSETYRRSSRYNAANYEVDPDNKLLWRVNPRTLDAEASRDAMLALSGQIDLKRPRASAVASTERPNRFDTCASATFRSVYLPIVRDKVPASLELFDFPDPNTTSAGRSESIVPTQALYMMNSPFVLAQANAMAAQLEKRFRTTNDRVRYAFLLAYGRPATAEEFQASVQFFRDFVPTRTAAQSERPSRGGRGGRAGRGGRRGRGGMRGGRGGRGGWGNVALATTASQPLAVFCQTLMASARFRIVN